MLKRPLKQSILEALVNELFDGFIGVPGALLNPPHQLVFAAFFVSKIIIGQLSVFLFELSFGDVPVAFDVEGIHIVFLFVCFVFIGPAYQTPGQSSFSRR